jgi:hypothetical protein
LILKFVFREEREPMLQPSLLSILRVRMFCHRTGILTLKILKKVLPPYTTASLDNIMMAKGVPMIRISIIPTPSAASTVSNGIPIRKKRTLFVMKPK